jgi:hypothetical protein
MKQAKALLEQAGRATYQAGLSSHWARTEFLLAKKNETTSTVATVQKGDQVWPDTARVLSVATASDGTGQRYQMIQVGGVVYDRHGDDPAWFQRGTAGSASMSGKDWAREETGSATSVRLVRSEDVDGVRCDVVEVVVDMAAYHKTHPSFGFVGTLADLLDLTDTEAVAALGSGSETDRFWIGQADHRIYRETYDYAADAGERGSVEYRIETLDSKYGRPVRPPIAVPSPVITPSSD